MVVRKGGCVGFTWRGLGQERGEGLMKFGRGEFAGKDEFVHFIICKSFSLPAPQAMDMYGMQNAMPLTKCSPKTDVDGGKDGRRV